MLQWGHAHSRVETRSATSRRSKASMLQWGHAHSRVETTQYLVQVVLAASASMGPRAFTRGDG